MTKSNSRATSTIAFRRSNPATIPSGLCTVGIKNTPDTFPLSQAARSAHLTFVAVDAAGNRIEVPQVIPETEHQIRRYEDAGRRREMRSGETQRKKELRAILAPEWHL